MAKGHEGVHRFTGLGDGDDEGIRSDDRISVPKLARQFDVDGQSCPMLDGVLRHHAGVGRSPTGNHDDLGDVAQHRVIERCLIQLNALLCVDASTKRVGDGFGLFCDFLQHEQVVATLFRRRGVPVHNVGLGLDLGASEIAHLDSVGPDNNDLVLTELECVTRVINKRRNVACEKIFSFSQTDHKRRIPSRSYDQRRVIRIHRHECERTFQARTDRLHRRR